MNNNNTNAYNGHMMDFDFNKQKKQKKRTYFVPGVIVLLLAVFGVFSIVFFGMNYVKENKEKKQTDQINYYNNLLIPVAAVDPSSFADVTTASMDEMIEVAVWSIFGRGLDPNNYDYSTGELAIPSAEVEAAFVAYFGTQVTIEHRSVEGYGYRFEYSADKACYYIPLTGISPVYTPCVVSCDDTNGVVTVTCGLAYSGAWQQDYATGEMKSPEPDKYITVTLRKSSSGTYISSIQTTGKPEIA